MFGPNARSFFGDTEAIHHRCHGFRRLIRDTEKAWRQKMGVPHTHDVLFLSGSGTFAIQSVIATFGLPCSVRAPEHEFASRIVKALQANRCYDASAQHQWQVLYETFDSRFDETTTVGEGLLFCDAVSGFPFYGWNYGRTWPDVVVTVSSKQIGALPVLGIVMTGPRFWRALKDNRLMPSCLDLRLCREYRLKHSETPHTPAIPLLRDLHDRLLQFDLLRFNASIANRLIAMKKTVPHNVTIGHGPVVTFKEGALSEELIERHGLYFRNGRAQIFLWSGSGKEFLLLRRDLKTFYHAA